MVNKAVLKKVNDVVGWIVSASMFSFWMYYFFVSKEFLKEAQFIIMWSFFGLLHGGRLIDARYFDDDFSVKKNGWDILIIAFSVFVVIIEAKRLFF
ncbi:MAG: hypothetical protein WBH44_02455 [Proteocatella sp.]